MVFELCNMGTSNLLAYDKPLHTACMFVLALLSVGCCACCNQVRTAVSLIGSARSTTVSMPALHCIIVSMHYNICNPKRGWVLKLGIVKALVLCTSGS